MKKTKIICTLGPATKDTEILKQLILAGMNVARFNFSHGTHDTHLEMINNLKTARTALNLPISMLLDTKGPEIRIGKFKNDETIQLVSNQEFALINDDILR